MAGIDRAMDKWRRKTDGREWKASVEGKRDEYARNLAEFAGISPSAVTVDDEWEEEVEAVSANEFNEAVEGKADKWRNNFLDGIQS